MTKQTKFKVGDRVRLIKSRGNVALFGAVGNVTAVGQYTHIKWDRNDDRVNGQSDGGYYEESFELVKPKEGDYIIAVKCFGTYAPANPPRVFVSEKQALTVAEKMANEHGGTFVVFKAIAEAVLPKQLTTVTKL